MNDTLTAVEGIRVGHWTHASGTTGCTVVLCPPEGCVISGSVMGAAPASRESALLGPEKLVERAHAVVLSGGSAFGLASAHGVVGWLEERGIGLETPGGRVPIVPAASLYDLMVAPPGVRPDEVAGRAAAEAATAAPVPRGRVGAGAGATAGKYLGRDRAVRTGLGSAAATYRGATVAALAVPNPAMGDVYSPAGGGLVAGHGHTPGAIARASTGFSSRENTTLVVVATDAPLAKSACASLAHTAHAGIARVVFPSHTPYDGDTTYVLSTGGGEDVPLGALAVLVQEVVARAVVDAAAAGSAGRGAGA